MRIEYFSETEFEPGNTQKYTEWIINVLERYRATPGALTFIYCSDSYLLDLNRRYLEHDYLTDVITFPYPELEGISGDIFISVDRVRDNANSLNVNFGIELTRVMIHGVLHLVGFKDKTEDEVAVIRNAEEEALAMFHVKQ